MKKIAVNIVCNESNCREASSNTVIGIRIKNKNAKAINDKVIENTNPNA